MKKVKQTPDGWTAAIADAEQKLSMAQERVSRLQTALRELREMKEAGVAWPRAA